MINDNNINSGIIFLYIYYHCDKCDKLSLSIKITDARYCQIEEIKCHYLHKN